jgi:hypothetical protein
MNIQQDKATLANLILSEISRRIADDWTKVTCTKSKYCYNDLSENEININFITENTVNLSLIIQFTIFTFIHNGIRLVHLLYSLKSFSLIIISLSSNLK